MTVAATTHQAVGPLAPLLEPGRRRLSDPLSDLAPGVRTVMRPYLLSLIAERTQPLLVVVPRQSDAEAMADSLEAFLGVGRVEAFPPWETLPHERLSPQPATVGRRLRVLDRIARPEAHDQPLLAVVAPIRAVLQPMDPALARRPPIEITTGATVDFDHLVQDLSALGYSHTPQVEARGEFAVRGGIVDVFPTAGDHAARIDFWGDEVESITEFAVGDQRSTKTITDLRIDPARELVLDRDLRDRAERAAKMMPSLREHLEQLAEGITFEGVESLVTLLHPRPALLPEFLPAGSGMAWLDPKLLRDRGEKLIEEAAIVLQVAWESLAGHEPEDVGFATVEEVLDRFDGPVWELSPFNGDVIPGEPWNSFKGDLSAASQRLARVLADGTHVIATTAGIGSANRLSEVLREEGTPAARPDEITAERTGRVEVVVSTLREGFLSRELGIAVIGEGDIFGARRRRRAGRRMATRKSAAETALALTDGDPVVHRTHGVGVYRGVTTREIKGPDGRIAKRDYVHLEYANGDSLWVPSDQVDAITRYSGGEEPTVMRLGGAQWEKAKNRVRKSVRDIAAELIRLYAVRMKSPGHAFSQDNTWMTELEEAFPHAETLDQLQVIDEVKRDMETPLPMDRLLAGDVGFGKTEVAVRAAAKAVFDGKQAVILCPTTILAQQHAETFRDRFAGFPIRIETLSRFVTGKERRAVLDGLAAGTVDLVIGTHALLARSVTFKDLGIVVVDEEQRFGVSQKERLKELRVAVDVLSMSATPIPRTLEMAITGLRDLSVIETPPEDRQPIVTAVQEFDDAQVALAIRRELLRDGQVFYVHNQVSTIHETAAWLQELVPDARIRVGHGQMDERELESVMVGFWERDYDVLCCTTIIESGLDIPNANTMIIERADLLGLSQLHQLRGRVGRSSERGYAYFCYPKDAQLTEEAYARLTTIAENTRLGSGLQIAMRDLEIRGAGNVIGAEQSGQVASVGFDMYAQLLAEEVADLNGEVIIPEIDITLELPVDAHLPHDYVSDERQRLELYRRISSIRDAAGVKDVRSEIEDRFGKLPPQAQRLLSLAALKAAMRRWGIAKVIITPKQKLRITPVLLSDKQLAKVKRMAPDAKVQSDKRILEVPVPNPTPGDLIGWVAGILKRAAA